MSLELIEPTWPAPANVRAVSTTRIGGVSQGCFASLNLGDHVGDREEDVSANRELLNSVCRFDSAPFWLNQTHSTTVLDYRADRTMAAPTADGSIARAPEQVCVVMTADCLPVLLTNKQGSQVAAIHAGWRGLADGILERAVARFRCKVEDVIAWLGPCIGPDAFEIGEDVAEQLGGPQAAYCPHQDPRKVVANLPLLAESRLKRLGLASVSHSNNCTFSDSERFFSYRRDGQTGRMATLIWLTS